MKLSQCVCFCCNPYLRIGGMGYKNRHVEYKSNKDMYDWLEVLLEVALEKITLG